MNTKIKRHSFEIFKNKNYLYIEGHRGVNRELPENTIESYKRAIEYNLDGIELDVWLTKDKIPIIIHGGENGNIQKTLNNNGIVSNYNLSQLKSFRTIKGNLTIPTLEEVFQLCKNKIFINVEIKDFQIEETFNKVIKLVEDYHMQNQIQISSFKHEYYWNCIKNYNECHNEKIEFGFLFESNDKKSINNFKFNAPENTINIYYNDISKELCNKAHLNGMKVMCWFGMNDIEDDNVYRNLIECGIDALCSNLPNEAKIFRDHFFH